MMARAARWLSCWRPGPARLALLLALLLAAPLLPQPAIAREAVAGKPQTGLKVVPLTITSGGKELHYKVEVAATEDQQATGMMFRTKVPPATGMIFPMNPPREASFWMRNTLVPLDIIFIGADGRVRNIVADAVPHSETPLNSIGQIAAVLELAGGEAARVGLKPGDRIKW